MNCTRLVPRPFCIKCEVGGKESGTHCFVDITLQYNFHQNICEALYMPCLLVRGSPKTLHCLVQPSRVEGRPPSTFCLCHSSKATVCHHSFVRIAKQKLNPPSELHKLCELAKDSFNKLHVQGGKHPKDSTGVGAPPHTQQVQPPAKRLTAPWNCFNLTSNLFHHHGNKNGYN